MVAAEKLLGRGIYTPHEAALYARISAKMMARWVYGTKTSSPVIDAELGLTPDRDVTFLDFVQALAIHRIRLERPRLSLQKIRAAYLRAKTHFSVSHPFALESSRIGLFGPPEDPSRQEIWICIGEDAEGARKFFQITGKKSGNQLMGEVVKTYADRLIFDDTTHLARKYYIFPTTYSPDDPDRIVMEPGVRFGEPYFETTGYTARTLYDAVFAEGSAERAAKAYGFSESQILRALDFFDFLKPALR